MLSIKEVNDFLKQSIFMLEKDDENKEVDQASVSGDRTDPPPTLKRSVPAKDQKEPEQKGDGGQDVGDQNDDKSKDKNKSKKKKSQEAVNYVKISPDPDKRCSNCNSFSTPKSCKTVDGDIDADGLCDIWVETPKEDE